MFLGSELGIAGGSLLWRGSGAVGGAGASGCGLEFRGQPNAVSGVGASGGDIDIAIASEKNTSGNCNVYVSSLNLGSINVASCTDNATTFAQTPVQAGLPIDDREWIAAFRANTSLLSYHDIATNDIDLLRCDNAGLTYTQIAQVIPVTDYKAQNNELGNLVIDHRNLPEHDAVGSTRIRHSSRLRAPRALTTTRRSSVYQPMVVTLGPIGPSPAARRLRQRI